MKIRAITLGANISLIEDDLDEFESILEEIKILKNELSENNIETQSIRLCTPPFSKDTHLNQSAFFTNPEIVLETLDDYCDEGLLDYYSAFPGLADQCSKLTNTQLKLIKRIPELLKNHKNMFSNIQVASSENGFNFQAIRECTKIIRELAQKDPFLNLKFATTFNVPSNTPFFPSAYHLGENSKITIALEAADEIVKIIENNSESKNSLETIKKEISNRFISIYDEISSIIKPFCDKNSILFDGVDFSPAQYPTLEKSIGNAIEKFGFGEFGDLGTVFAVGFLTDALKSIDRPKIGFSGFMQPLLEDYIIALRHDQGKINLTKLLLNSTVCGLGLDCIPLPGNIEANSLNLLMMDVAMISYRLKKPLTCRLMPIPSKTSNDRTEFEFEYFTNSKICELEQVRSKKIEDFIEKNPYFGAEY